jgi:hypothetical protein
MSKHFALLQPPPCQPFPPQVSKTVNVSSATNRVTEEVIISEMSNIRVIKHTERTSRKMARLQESEDAIQHRHPELQGKLLSITTP